jgi:hypothetical protein
VVVVEECWEPVEGASGRANRASYLAGSIQLARLARVENPILHAEVPADQVSTQGDTLPRSRSVVQGCPSHTVAAVVAEHTNGKEAIPPQRVFQQGPGRDWQDRAQREWNQRLPWDSGSSCISLFDYRTFS